MDLKILGDTLENRRVSLNLRQEDLSEMSGVTVRTIYNIEQGKGNPSIETLNKICEILGLDILIDIKKLNV